ncbi:MAG: PAS domain S-box protein, partial [Spirochaetes bacterium]|nr:PAS domain S-box protein [Spirochaetota bacterium]
MKIANKISLSFFVTVLILVIVTISVVYVETKDFLQDAISAHLITTAESRVRHVETFLETQKDRIIQLSQSIVIRGFLSADKRDAAYKKHYNNTIKRLQGTEKIFKDVDEIFVLDVNGKIVASSNEREIGLDRSGNAYFLGGKLDSYIKDIYLSKATDEKSFAVSAPIMDEKTGNLLGVVVARIGLDLLEKITTDNAGLGKTGEIFLVNQYGYVITPLRFIKETFLIRKIDSEDMKKALSHIKRNSDKPFAHYPFLYKDYRGVRVFGMHQHIAGIKGVLFAKIDEKEVMAPLLRLKILFASAVVIILLIAWLLGSVIARFIVGPIHELHKGTEIVGSGDLNYEVGTQSNDEIGQLSRAFDKMTENLRETSVSKDYVNNIIETMTGSLVVMDSKGIITDVNRATCDLLGYPEEELIGEDISLLFPEEEKIPLKGTQLEKLIKKGLLINYETYYVIKEGSKIPVLLSGAVMRNKEGDVTNIVCIAKDVTEEKGFKL